MTKIYIENGLCFAVPDSDIDFFKAFARKMGWHTVQSSEKNEEKSVWTDSFAGKWTDSRTAEQIIDSIHKARTQNPEIKI